MRVFYTRLTRGENTVNLVGEATMENLTAAAATARQMLADGWTFVPQAELAAEVRRATMPTPDHYPPMQ